MGGEEQCAPKATQRLCPQAEGGRLESTCSTFHITVAERDSLMRVQYQDRMSSCRPPGPRLSTSTLHELATAASNHPCAPARQSLCVSAGPQCRASLLFSLGRPLQSLRSRAATAAHSRQPQLCKSSRPAQPYTKPIGSREGRLPSSRCI